MGSHMARNLARAGLLRGVWNRTAEKATALAAELKCHAFVDLTELAANSEAVVICVSADDDVRAVVDGLEPGLSPRMIVMDCSTVGSATARDMHARLSPLGVGFLDCPVSGGVEGARAGNPRHHGRRRRGGFLARYADSRQDGQDRRALGSERRRPGDQGHQPDHVRGDHSSRRRGDGVCPRGRAAARTGDRDPRQGCGLELVLRQSSAVHGEESYPAGFKVRLHAKDLRICRDMAARAGGAVPGGRLDAESSTPHSWSRALATRTSPPFIG